MDCLSSESSALLADSMLQCGIRLRHGIRQNGSDRVCPPRHSSQWPGRSFSMPSTMVYGAGT